jgi:hypothetical protein
VRFRSGHRATGRRVRQGTDIAHKPDMAVGWPPPPVLKE